MKFSTAESGAKIGNMYEKDRSPSNQIRHESGHEICNDNPSPATKPGIDLDRLRSVLDLVATLDSVNHRDLMREAKAVRFEVDRELCEATTARVLLAFDQVVNSTERGTVAEHAAATLRIGEAINEAPDIGAAVLAALLALDCRHREINDCTAAVSDAQSLSVETHERVLTKFPDVADLYTTVLEAGIGGMPLRELGRELTSSRRSSAIRRLRGLAAVTETRVPNPRSHPSHHVWLHAIEAVNATTIAQS